MDSLPNNKTKPFWSGLTLKIPEANQIEIITKITIPNNDLGLAGPINNNNRILTQAFVSRKHMEIFGWFLVIKPYKLVLLRI